MALRSKRIFAQATSSSLISVLLCSNKDSSAPGADLQIVCGLSAANATYCSPVTNFNCTCQYSNQAIILPILESCLAKSCTDAAQSSAAISAGEVICATVSQTGSSLASFSLPTRAVASSTGTVAPTTAKSSSTASPSVTTPATYTGAAAMATAGVEALVAAAGMAMLAL